MKVLHVTDNYTIQGGVQQYILSVGRLLADHGHSNAVLYTKQSALTVCNGAWPAYYVRTDGDLAAQVQEVLDTEQPDVAYIHHVSSAALIEFLASRLPSVAYVHGFTAVCPGLAKYFRRGDVVCRRPFGWGCFPMHYFRRCSATRHPRTLYHIIARTARLKDAFLSIPRILVATDYMKNLLVQNGFDGERISLLPPHFFTQSIAPEYLPPQESTTILYAGRLEIEKGITYLLQAIAQSKVSYQLLIAGEGTCRPQYEMLAHMPKLNGRVRFLGWLDKLELQAVYQRAALLVMPTIMPEPFGKVGIEALFHGRPVVAFNVGGISDWLQDGVNGFLVPPRDIPTLSSRIQRLLKDKDLCTAMGLAGQEIIARRYVAQDHLKTLLSAFGSARSQYAIE